MKDCFPLQVAQHSLLFKWQGQNAALNPVLFVSHLDVVPATVGSHSGWSKDPFSGEVTDKWATAVFLLLDSNIPHDAECVLQSHMGEGGHGSQVHGHCFA